MKIVWNYRAQFLIVFVFVSSLYVPHQLRDVLRAFALEPSEYGFQIVLAGIALLFLSYELFWTSEKVGQRISARTSNLSLSIASAPFVALSICCIRAATEVPATGDDYTWGLSALTIVGWIGLIIAGAGIALVISEKRVTIVVRLSNGFNRLLMRIAVPGTISLLMVFLGMPFLDGTSFVFITQVLGPLSISWFALLLYLVGLSWLTELSERHNFPFVASLVVAIVAFQWLGWNDNHDIREIASDKSPQEFEAAFLDWYVSRKALAPQHRVPVIIVATQGGGIYAARHSATVLARLQDDCPAFAQNVFAISGVSGGSLGAAVFASAVNDLGPDLQTPTCDSDGETAYQDYVEAALYRDFLSPTLWLWLLPEMVQVLLPFPAIHSYDRALGLEYGIESTAIDGSKFYTDGILESWSADKAVPALFLNTARTGTGQQLYLSPLTLTEIPGSDTQPGSLHEYRRAPFDVRVSTATGLSARFPVVSSVGRFTAKIRNANNEPLDPTKEPVELYHEENLALVDGGFADNSGGETALRIFRRVATLTAEHGLDVRLEIVFIGDVSYRHADILRWVTSISDLSEEADPRFLALVPPAGDRDDGAHILTPVLALNNARSDRSRLASTDATEMNSLIAETVRGVCNSLFSEAERDNPKYLECFALRLRSFAGRTLISYSEPSGTVPLGWMLSKLSDDRVAALRLGSEFDYGLCGSLPDEQVDLLHEYGETLLAAYDRQQNACLMNQIRRTISLSFN
ncbi:MAG: hypothetical protein AAFN16_00615 [Pseudomonadota bacterium]